MGNHTFKAGLDIRLLRSNVNFGGDYYIPVISTDNDSNPADVPALPGLDDNDRANAQQNVNDLTGTIGFIRQDFKTNSKEGFTPYEPPHRYWRAREYSFFFQDTWKVSPHLTVNLGLRYEVFGVPYEDKGIFTQPVGGAAGIWGVVGPTGQPTQTGFAEDGGSKVYSVDWNNFAPNIGFTWDPFKDGLTSVSANYRVAYDRVAMTQHLFLDYSNEGTTATDIIYPDLRFSDPNIYQSVGGQDAIFPRPVPELFAPIPNLRRGIANTIDPDLYVPYTNSWSLRIQREVLRRTTVSIAYVGNGGSGLHRAWNLNTIQVRGNGFLQAFQAAQRNLAANGNPNMGEDVGLLGSLFPATEAGMVASIPSSLDTNIEQGQVARVADQIDRGQVGGDPGELVENAGLPAYFFRANPQYQTARIVGNLSTSSYHGMKLEVTRRFQDGLYFQGNYTLSKSLTDYVGGQGQGDDYRDNDNRQLDNTYANFDATHVVNMNGIYELPFGRGRRWMSGTSGFVDHLIGGWQINGILGFTTGWPLTVDGGRNNLTVGDQSTADYSGTDFKIFNKIQRGEQISTLTDQEKELFSDPPAGSPGGLAQRSFRGLNFWNFDVSMFKDFAITEGMRIQMRFEFFNAFNNVRFDQRNLNDDYNSASFGNVTAALNPRIIQFAAKFIF
jgi:hypothetical protein